MSGTLECGCDCATPETINTPGTSGTNGKNAYTTTTANLVVPADTTTPVSGTFADTSWMVAGQTIIIGNATNHGTFTVNGVPASATSASLLWQNANGDAAAGATIASGSAVSPMGKTPKLSGVTALTDNSTGTVGSTIAAGVGVFTLAIPIQLVAMTTAAADLATNYTPGFRFKVLAISFVTTTLGTGAGASQILNFEIGSTNLTGGVLTLTLATTTPLGNRIDATAITANNIGTAADTLSLEVAAGGTVFTAGAGIILVQVQNLDAADAFASIADKLNDVIDALD